MSRIKYKNMKVYPEQNIVGDCLMNALAENENVAILASSLATHTLPTPENPLAMLVKDIATKYPARFFGIGELLESLVHTATKLWTQHGMRSIVIMGAADLARSYASLSAACVAKLPVIFLLVSNAGEGQTWQHENASDLAILRTLPSLYIGAPGDAAELNQHLMLSLAEENHPIALRFYPLPGMQPKAFSKPNLGAAFGIGKAQMLHEGKDLAILALGASVATAIEVSEILDKKGYQAAVVNARWARPLDEPLLSAIVNYFPRIITLEDGDTTGGFGSAVLELLEKRGCYNVKVRRFGLSFDGKLSVQALAEEISTFLERVNRQDVLSHAFPSLASSKGV